MARKRKNGRIASGYREVTIPSLAELVSPAVRNEPIRTISRPIDDDDRRTWTPDRVRIIRGALKAAPPRHTTPRVSRVSRGKLEALPPSRLAFAEPRTVSLCDRRRRRREVLFATQRVRSGKGQKKRRTEFSEIGCS